MSKELVVLPRTPIRNPKHVHRQNQNYIPQFWSDVSHEMNVDDSYKIKTIVIHTSIIHARFDPYEDILMSETTKC